MIPTLEDYIKQLDGSEPDQQVDSAPRRRVSDQEVSWLVLLNDSFCAGIEQQPVPWLTGGRASRAA